MKRFFIKAWVVILLLSVILTPFNGLVALAASADDPYIFFYPKNNADDLKKAASDGKIGPDDNNGILSKTYIATTGGKLGVVQIPLNPDVSDQQDHPVYTLDYYCTPSDNKITTVKPDDSVKYFRLTFAVALRDWSDTTILGKDYSGRAGFQGQDAVGTYHAPATPDTDPNTPYNGTAAINDDIAGGGNSHLSIWSSAKYTTQNYDSNGNSLTGAINNQLNACLIKPTDNIGNKIANYQALPPTEQAKVDDKLNTAGLGATAAAAAGNNTTPPGSSAPTQNCTGGSFGWLLCPAINYMSQAIHFIATLIDNLLTVRFLSSQSGGTSIEGIWRAILSVANIMLVIAFMFLIVSQTSSQGMSNYGIKKMLPRLIIAAILMNLSFYICALLIDFSNIIGASVMGFLLGSNNNISDSVASVTGGDNGLLYSVGQGATTAAIGVGLVILIVCLFAPILLGILAVFVAIIGRQVALLVLVLISPLAFVAWVLPNTEKYFKQWWSMFFELLILYPLVMLVFGAGLLLSNLLGSAGDSIRFG